MIIIKLTSKYILSGIYPHENNAGRYLLRFNNWFINLSNVSQWGDALLWKNYEQENEYEINKYYPLTPRRLGRILHDNNKFDVTLLDEYEIPRKIKNAYRKTFQ